MSMSCAQFDEQLMDLVYNELDAETAEEMRTHAAVCPVCGEALAGLLLTRRMAASLEAPAPPDEAFDQAIIAAAAQFARPSDAEAAFSGEIRHPQRINTGPTFFERLRALVLMPAFATAAVTLLVCVITLFLAEKSPVETGRESEGAAPGFKEVLPSVAMQEVPAGRERRSTGAATPIGDSSTPSREPPVAAQAQPPIAAVPPQASRSELEELRPSGQNSQTSPAFNLGTGGTLPTEAFPAAAPKAEASAKDAARRPADRPQSRGLATGGGASLNDAWASPPSSPQKSARPSDESAPLPQASTDYDLGMAAYQRGDCASAKVALSRVVTDPSAGQQQVASALHHLARCEKRSGQCGRAVPYYEQVITRYPSYPNRPDALYEAAQCRRRLGHLTTARSLLDELSRSPGWESRAKEALDQLDDSQSKARE